MTLSSADVAVSPSAISKHGQAGAIRVFGAREHNLRGVDVVIPRARFTVVTGVSGSGKSSLALDTIYAEGQRRYIESLSAYARQFLEQLQKPDVDRIEGLAPTLAIEQRMGSAGPRSTVATTTELLDHLRVLFARAGTAHCWECGRAISRTSVADIVDEVLSLPEGSRVLVLAPLVEGQRGKHTKLLERLRRDGFVRVRVDGEVRMLDELEELHARKPHDLDVVVDRIVIKPDIAARLTGSVELAVGVARGRVSIAPATPGEGSAEERAFTTVLACPDHPENRIEHLSPRLLSFNSPQGACEECHGLGTRLEFDEDLVVPDRGASLKGGAIAALRKLAGKSKEVYHALVGEFCERFDVLPDAPLRNLPERKVRILLHGTDDEDEASFGASFEGVIPNLKRRWAEGATEAVRRRLHAFLDESPCEACGGSRLNRSARSVRIGKLNLAEVCAKSISEALAWATSVSLDAEREKIAKPLLREIDSRLRFLVDAGVEYLTLDRKAQTLSGGEFQRIRLATQIGAGLSGVCYVLDEPTIGLHPRDTAKLIDVFRKLTAIENTVIVVEHDEDVIRSADYIIDIGPGAGERGGALVAEGSLADIESSKASVTGAFLSGRERIAVPKKRRAPNFESAIGIHGATANNLKGIDVRFPLGVFICVTGVSGSGKSTLVNDCLHRAVARYLNRGGSKPGAMERISGASLVDRVIEIDQAPIGRSPRSNPATFVGALDLIRELFSKTREAKIRGYGPARFSFNVRGGRCEHCEGQGTKRIKMHFLPDVFVTCGHCGGSRFNRDTLDIRYRGKTIADVLDMSVDEAAGFFDNFENIRRRIKALADVGLGYVRLGQASNTLSGGEAQRVKLASELHKTTIDNTLYVLDEPTTGLHPADVRNLVALLQRLVDRGHTVVVIEHNLSLIRCADWVIDLGPEGGDAGGAVVAEGAPEEIAACEGSHTGAALRALDQ